MKAHHQVDPFFLSRERPAPNRATRRVNWAGSVRHTNMRILDDKDVVRLLRSVVKRAGGQSSWARTERIDRTMLNRVLCGHKPPTTKIIRALKLCNVYALDGREDRRNGSVDFAPSTAGLES